MNKRKQHGGALGTFLLIVFFMFTAIIGMKVFPAYMEYFNVKQTLQAIAAAGEANGGARDAKAAFVRRAGVAGIKGVSAEEIRVDNGVVSAEYSVTVPLFANLRLVIDFEASSAK